MSEVGMNDKAKFFAVRTADGFIGMDSVTTHLLVFQSKDKAERCRASFNAESIKEIYIYNKEDHEAKKCDRWTDSSKNPGETGEYIVDSSFGVTTAYFQSTVSGQLYWQEAKTNTNEGDCNWDDEEFEVYAWMPMPEKYSGPRG